LYCTVGLGLDDQSKTSAMQYAVVYIVHGCAMYARLISTVQK